MRFRLIGVAASLLAILAATLVDATPAHAADGFSGGEYSTLYFTNTSTTMCAEVHWVIETSDSRGTWQSFGEMTVKPTFSWTPIATYVDSGFYAYSDRYRRVYGEYYVYAFGSSC
jgi:hypothetical protein